MKIGISVQSLHGSKTGLGVYTEGIVNGLQTAGNSRHQFFLYEKKTAGDLNTLRRLYWENIELMKLTQGDRIDLLHIPAFAPPICKCFRLVVTVHDLIGMIFPNQMGLPSQLYWGQWLPYAVRKADVMVVDSENTKKDVLKYLQVPEKKIRVVYPSGHERFAPNMNSRTFEIFKSKIGVQDNYFLSVGTLEPRKNLTRILQAFGEFRKKKRSVRHQLVIVGSKDFAYGRAFKALATQAVLDSNDVIFTGYVEDEILNDLYGGATAFLFPSLYEGFGIPVLEAMAAGAPVITSNLSSLPEVAGTAAYFVNPYRVDEITEAMNTFSENSNVRQDFIDKGFQRINKFSWKQAARQLLEVYESLA